MHKDADVEVKTKHQAGETTADAVVVLPFFEGDGAQDLSGIARHVEEQLGRLIEQGAARTTLYDMTFIHPGNGNPGVLIVGAEKPEDFSPLIQMRVAAAASRYLTGRGFSQLLLVDRGMIAPFEFARAVTEGVILGAYNEAIKKTRPSGQRTLGQITLVSASEDREALEQGSSLGRIVGEARNLARHLVNLPPNELTPRALADRANEVAAENGLECRVLNEDDLRELGMGALLGVAAGSEQPPRVVVLRYGNPNAPVRLAVVGKGLTFDSGGLSLKPAESMETMKSDMSGAAAVIGGLVAIAQMKPEGICVTGYIGATENMTGSGAMRPGDVLTAMNGETIEVLNTDAEGRLVLADVLSYAIDQGESTIVDFATLTGGAVVALGHAATLASGRPSDWVAEVVDAADSGLERAWQMPLYPEYREAMNSDVADIKNTGGRAGSALTATAFLSDFTGEARWAHMDIAGTAFEVSSSKFRGKGGTGEGVGTIVSLARRLARGQEHTK